MSRYKKRSKRSSSSGRPRWLPLAAIIVGLILVGGVGFVLLSQDKGEFVPEVSGAPRVMVQDEVVDYGDVKINTPIETVFKVQNVGDEPLEILGQPQVELVEGC